MFNSKNLKTILEKINWLSKTFEENNYTDISALEKSLLKEKIRMFYEEVEHIPTSDFKRKNETASPFSNHQEKTMVIEDNKLEEEPSLEPPEAKARLSEAKKAHQTKAQIETVANPNITQENPKINSIQPKTRKVAIDSPIVQNPKETPIAEAKTASEIKKENFLKREKFNRELALPKRDIREIIDLNKSFILKANLFQQNNDLYREFISEINKTRNEEAAEIVIKNWIRKLNWKTEENKAFELLERVIEKRFLPLI